MEKRSVLFPTHHGVPAHFVLGVFTQDTPYSAPFQVQMRKLRPCCRRE